MNVTLSLNTSIMKSESGSTLLARGEADSVVFHVASPSSRKSSRRWGLTYHSKINTTKQNISGSRGRRWSMSRTCLMVGPNRQLLGVVLNLIKGSLSPIYYPEAVSRQNKQQLVIHIFC